MHKRVCLLCVLMVYPVSAAADEGQQQGGDVASGDFDSAWKYRMRLNKFERQFSASDDNDFAEWAGFIVADKGLDKFWLTTKAMPMQ